MAELNESAPLGDSAVDAHEVDKPSTFQVRIKAFMNDLYQKILENRFNFTVVFTVDKVVSCLICNFVPHIHWLV